MASELERGKGFGQTLWSLPGNVTVSAHEHAV
jgi:hypothetical protein